MATKGINIKSAIPDENKASGTISTVHAKIKEGVIVRQADGTYKAVLTLDYFRTVSAGDADATPIRWDGLKSRYEISIAQAEMDGFYNKLETEMAKDFASTAKAVK